jgi:hypothetical protein
MVPSARSAGITTSLLSKTDAMQLYNALPDHHLEFTQAFAD